MPADRVPEIIKISFAPPLKCWAKYVFEPEHVSDDRGNFVVAAARMRLPFAKRAPRPRLLALRLERGGKLSDVMKGDKRD